MNLYDFSFETITGQPFDVESLKGKKVLIVNTASECGLTPQFDQLEDLYDEYKSDKFEILGFPSNDFGEQDPGSNDEIAAFCRKNYGVTFPMMSKIVVKGEGQHPLFQWLTSKTGEDVKWNFHKFLVDETGAFVRDVHPQTLPIDETILSWIQS